MVIIGKIGKIPGAEKMLFCCSRSPVFKTVVEFQIFCELTQNIFNGIVVFYISQPYNSCLNISFSKRNDEAGQNYSVHHVLL